jgi:ankyrin repeat protein
MADEFVNAALRCDLPCLQRMLADGEARIADTDFLGHTALLHAARGSDALPTLKWLLEEGGARITERKYAGYSALLLAAWSSRLVTCQWFLEHGGADIKEASNAGKSVWDKLAKE